MIHLDDVSVKFVNGTLAVSNVTLSAEEGQILCIIGTSGSGKTTLLKLLNRLVEPTHGQIFFEGKKIEEYDPTALRRSMGYVIQEGGLLPHLTVLENITLIPQVCRIPKKQYLSRANELLHLVHLDPALYAGRYPKQLSGGQRQRVGIARALMNKPPILLMDEPFGALDPITRKRLQQELLQLNEKLQKTILFVTHDLEEAFLLGDTIVLMKEGNIVQKGSPDAFMKTPANAFVEQFVEGKTA